MIDRGGPKLAAELCEVQKAMAAAGGSQRIATFDGKQLFGQQTTLPPVLFGDYFAPLTGLDPLNYRGGVSLEINDVDGDGHNDVVITPTVDVGVGPDFGIVVFHGSLDGNQHRLRYQKWVGNEVPKHADGQDQYMSLFDNVFRPLAG